MDDAWFVRRLRVALTDSLCATCAAPDSLSEQEQQREPIRRRQAGLSALRQLATSSDLKFLQNEQHYDDNDYCQHVADLICQSNLALALAIVTVCHQNQYDDIIHIILALLDSRGLALKFVFAIIEKEVAETDSESLLFRGNSLATRILTCYARTHGYHFLRETLRDLLLTLCRSPPEFSLDFDPHSTPAENDIGTRNLENATESFLRVIISHWKSVPKSIRDICHFMSLVVADKFPNSVFTSIGGFIFLRFINPAIIQPESIDLDLPLHSRELRRGLIMITKILQALANNIRFGARDPGMRALNDFMLRNIFPMTRYLRDISRGTPLDTDELVEIENIPLSLNKYDREILRKYLNDSLDRIQNELPNKTFLQPRQWHDGSERFSIENLKATLEKFNSLMTKWNSQEQEVQTPSSSLLNGDHSSSRSSQEHVNEYSTWSKTFYETTPSKDNIRTFYYVCRNFDYSASDAGSFARYASNLILSVDTSVNLFIDCTLTSTRNDIPLTWIKYFIDTWSDSGPQINNIFIFSPTIFLTRTLRQISSSYPDTPVWRRVIPVSHINKLESYFQYPDQLLNPLTSSVFSEKRIVYNSIVYVQKYVIHSPVLFKLGDDTIMIETVKPIDISQDLKCQVRSVLDYKDFKDVQKVSQSFLGDAFVFNLYSDSSSWSFVDQRYERYELIPAINHRRRKKTGLPKASERTLSMYIPVPEPAFAAALFNAALLNLCHLNASIREIAYGVLVLLVSSFQLSALDGLNKTTPSVNLNFLAALNESLSGAVPNLALDLLENALIGLQNSNRVQAVSYLHCLQPWIQTMVNQSSFGKYSVENVQKRKKAVVEGLVLLAFEDIGISQCLQLKVWPSIAKSDELSLVVMSKIIEITASEAFDYDTTEHALSSLVSMQSFGMRPKIFYMLRKAITAASERRKPHISSTLEWSLITAQVQADLELSFLQGRGVQLVVPDILHMVTLLAGIGSPWFRNVVYSEIQNLVSALFSSKNEVLQDIQSNLSSQRMKRHFGLLPGQEVSDNEQSFEESATFELVALIQRILKDGASSIDTENMWRARLVSLLTKSSFEPCPKLQERAFLALGQMCEGITDEDLLYQCFVTLGKVIVSTHDSLASSILSAIVQMAKGLPYTSDYCIRSFWVGVILLQVNSRTLVSSALSLISVSLDRMKEKFEQDENPPPSPPPTATQDLWQYSQLKSTLLLNSAYEDALRNVVESSVNQAVRFDPYFTFAIGGLLMKCAKRYPEEKVKAIQILRECIRITCNEKSSTTTKTPSNGQTNGNSDQISITKKTKVPENILGYFISLVALQDDIHDLFRLVSVEPKRTDSRLLVLDNLEIPDGNEHRLLISTILFYSVLCHSQDFDELSVVCSLLAELARVHPEIVKLFNDSMVEKLEEMISTSEDISLRTNAKSILYSMRSVPIPNEESESSRQARTFLELIGFSGLSPDVYFTLDDEGKSTQYRQLISNGLLLNI